MIFNKENEKEISNKIYKMYTAGMPAYKIKQQFDGLKMDMIKRILIHFKLQEPVQFRKTPFYIIKEMVDLYQSGNSSKTIAILFDSSPALVCKLLKNFGVKLRPSRENKRKFPINFDYMKNITTEEQAYFLGFMYADGNVHKGKISFKITVKDIDQEILDKIAKLFYKDDYSIYVDSVILKDGTLAYYKTLDVSCKEMCADLIRHGCTPNKTFTVKYPEWMPDYLVRHFIRGCFDGDGCIKQYNGKQYIKSFKNINDYNDGRVIADYTGCVYLLNGMIQVIKDKCDIKNINLINRVGKPKDFEIKSFRICKSIYVERFFDFIYKDATIYLDRKYNKYLQIKSNIKQKNNRMKIQKQETISRAKITRKNKVSNIK